MKRIIAIVGPTGIGKSRLALHLAPIFQGEIVSADSRQVYRYMDIGTAKPTAEELKSVPHHLIDIVNPDDDFNLAAFQELAGQSIADIHKRNKLPFLVGGTGLYVKAVLEGWQVPRVSPDVTFRYNKAKGVGEGNVDELYQELLVADPHAAVKIDRRNVRRVIRALEVHAKSGQASSRRERKIPPPFTPLIIGLTTPRSSLYNIVDRRVDSMIERGLVKEVENLLGKGYNFTLPSMSGIGYRQIGQYLSGELTLEAAVSKIKTETHRFIRHQYAWFRLSDEKIRWFDVEQTNDSVIERTLKEFLKE